MSEEHSEVATLETNLVEHSPEEALVEGEVGAEGEEGEEKVKRERKQYNVPADVFCRTWQESGSAQEVANKLGMPKNIVLARSAVYRKPRKDGTPGIPLKKMPRINPRRLDVDALRKLVEETGGSDVKQAEVEVSSDENGEPKANSPEKVSV